MPTGENKPRCPFCQAEFTGEHACQNSDKDDYYRRMTVDGVPNSGPDVRNKRKFDGRLTNEAITPEPYPYKPPWEREKEQEDYRT